VFISIAILLFTAPAFFAHFISFPIGIFEASADVRFVFPFAILEASEMSNTFIIAASFIIFFFFVSRHSFDAKFAVCFCE
jgi:hypothetical protein